MVSGIPIPGNWQDFLHVDSNKADLFHFLSLTLINPFNLKDKQLVVINGELILSKPLLDDPNSISPCTHEEADTHMLLHAQNVVFCGYNAILIRTVDTDVVALAVAAMQESSEQVKLYIAFGTGKHFRYIVVHQIANSLGPQKALAGSTNISCLDWL